MDPIPSPRRASQSITQSPQDRPKLRRGISAVRIDDKGGSVHTYNEVLPVSNEHIAT